MKNEKGNEKAKPYFSDVKKTQEKYFKNSIVSIVGAAVLMLIVILVVELELI